MYSSTETGGTDPGVDTDRLYYTDAYITSFTARVAVIVPPSGAEPGGVVLDRTAFYPTSGGQPHDTGRLRPAAGAQGELHVADVVERGGGIVHVLSGPVAPDTLPAGAEVSGAVDWDRRFDHMQQHTAQHVLSALFLKILGAETASVHLGDSSTLDLEIPALAPEDAQRVEEAANRIVFEGRPVTARFVDAAQAEALGLRRPPRRTGSLRVIDIQECDRSACGGTHVRTTAEIGLVLLRRWERTRGRIRVEFLAGWRAVRDYRWKHALVAEWSTRLTVRDRDLGDALHRLAASAQEHERALADARRHLVGYEAVERLAGARDPTAPSRTAQEGRILRLEFSGRDPEEVRLLLREMTSRERCVVLAGILDTGRLYFARSPGAAPDLAALLGGVCRTVGGRGGGTAEFAQGTVPPGEAVTRALALAEQEARGA